MEQQATDTNLLQDIEQEIYLEPASTGLRFANYIIDLLFFYGILFVYGMTLGLMYINTGENFDESFVAREDGSAILLQYLLFYILFIATYTIIEALSKGKAWAN